MGASPLTDVDDGLLRCMLMLSKESESIRDPAGGAVLTAWSWHHCSCWAVTSWCSAFAIRERECHGTGQEWWDFNMQSGPLLRGAACSVSGRLTIKA